MDKKTCKCSKVYDVKGVELYGVTYEFSQESDTCQCEDEGQSLRVFTEDGGGGCYVCISTKRWAIDNDEIDKFAAMLKHVVGIPHRT